MAEHLREVAQCLLPPPEAHADALREGGQHGGGQRGGGGRDSPGH